MSKPGKRARSAPSGTATASLRIDGLAALGAVRAELRERARLAAEAEARERERLRRLERERRLFADAVGAVTPLPEHGRAELALPRPAPEARQRELDEQAALREALSDEVDVESLLLTDDGLSFRRSGVSPEVVHKLRRGHWAIQAEIDLHGLRRDEARDALSEFIRTAEARGQRCLRVVHGKGHGSPGRQPVLKAKVQRWLGQRAAVIAFTQASGPLGGAGALIVLLAGTVDAHNRPDPRRGEVPKPAQECGQPVQALDGQQALRDPLAVLAHWKTQRRQEERERRERGS